MKNIILKSVLWIVLVVVVFIVFVGTAIESYKDKMRHASTYCQQTYGKDSYGTLNDGFVYCVSKPQDTQLYKVPDNL